MRIHGVIEPNIRLNEKHRLTLTKMYELGFTVNWIRTTYPEELLVYKNDLEDNNYITAILYADLLDIQTSFNGLDFTSVAASQLRNSFDAAVALIYNIYYETREGS